MDRRKFLTASGSAIGAVALPVVGTATAADDPSIETNEVYSVFDFASGNFASVQPDHSGEFQLQVNGKRVHEVNDPLWFSWGRDEGYGAVCDAGDIKCLDTNGTGTDVATATSNGDDSLPVISGGDVFFDRVESVYKITNIASLFDRGRSSAQRAGRSMLPSGNLGGRNAGRKKVYGVERGGYRVQVKMPERNRYRGALGHNDAVLAGNLEIWEVNRFVSNDLIQNWHLGYRRDSGRRPHCLSLFETETNRGGERCFRSLRRMIRSGANWVKRQALRSVAFSSKVLLGIAKALAFLGTLVGGALASPFLS